MAGRRGGNNSTIGGNDPAMGNPKAIRDLESRLNDPRLSQRERSRLRKRLKELNRSQSKRAHESKKGLTPKIGPKFLPFLLIPGHIFDPCFGNPHCTQAKFEKPPNGETVDQCSAI